MDSKFLQTVSRLRLSGASFVTASVVSRRAPVSSHLGDWAIVHEGGRMEGFVGGSCSREIVRRQALEALRLGRPRLVLIRPDASEAALLHAGNAESVVVPMTCASEGSVDVYIEPHVPAPLLLVVGLTPVAEAVARLGAFMERDVVRVVTATERGDLTDECRTVALDELPAFLEGLSDQQRAGLAAVIASQGHYDEPALEPLLRLGTEGTGVGFVGLLASRKRAVTVRELLELQGLSSEQTARIRNPVGLNLGAKTPAEVAVSILAEIIAAGENRQFTSSGGEVAGKRPSAAAPMPNQAGAVQTVAVQTAPVQTQELRTGLRLPRPGFALSPVDGEEIEIATAVHFAEQGGQTYYFTCANCKRRFLKDPQQFLGQPERES
jgi:xanthine dehydrogenase accessory factor